MMSEYRRALNYIFVEKPKKKQKKKNYIFVKRNLYKNQYFPGGTLGGLTLSIRTDKPEQTV